MGEKSITQFTNGFSFSGQPYGLNQPFNLDITGDSVSETLYKYSGNLGTYTAKHYPTAVKEGETIYFVFSGPVDLDNKHWFSSGGQQRATTSGDGEINTAPLFRNPVGKSEALGIYVAKYEPAGQRVTPPILVHVKYTDDPHDNAVINIDDEGYIYILVAGRGETRGAFLYRSQTPRDIIAFDDISPESVNYSNDYSDFDGRVGIAYPKLFWVDSDGGYFRLIYTVYCGEASCGGRNIFTAELRVDGAAKATMESVTRIANYLGHYAIANARGEDIVLAFNVHLNGKVDDRTNLYYLHSSDGGKTWRNAQNLAVSLPLDSQTAIEQAVVRKYHQNGQQVFRRIYLKDIQFSGTGNNKRPFILYVGALNWDAPNSYQPSLVVDHYLAKSYWDGSQWSQYRITDDVDHAYSSGMLVPTPDVDLYDIYYPKTPQDNVGNPSDVRYNNALAGGALAKTWSEADLDFPDEPPVSIYLAGPPALPTSASYLETLCEVNYIRPIHNNTVGSSTVGIAAYGNPYKYTASSPLVIVETDGARKLPQNFLVPASGWLSTTPFTGCQ